MKTSYSLLAFGIATALGSQQAGAQESAADDTNTIVLEEIQVVARKQTESMQDVPMAISAITADQMQAAGIRDVGDITVKVPSLVVTSNSNPFNTSYRIRRIGNEGNIPDFEPDTGLFVDGAYRSRSGLGLGDLADIEQIEVLRGPQSTLYGRNVTAGAINVRTALPSQTFGAMGEVTAGNDGYYAVRSYLTGGLSDSVAARISVTGAQRDAMDTNLIGEDSNTLDQYAVRGQLLFNPGAWQIRLIGSHVNRDMRPSLAEMFYGPSVKTLVDGTVTQAAALGALDGAGGVDGVINSSARTILDNDPLNRIVQAMAPLGFQQKSSEGIASIEYGGDAITFVSLSSYDIYDITQTWNDAGQTGLDLVNYRDFQTGETISQEFRIGSSESGVFNWLGGVYYYDNHFERGDKNHHEFTLGQAIDELGYAAGRALASLPDVAVFGMPGDTGDYFEISDSQSHGAFAQGTWNATDALAFTLGARYTEEKKEVSLVNTPYTSATGTVGALSLPVRTLTPAASSFALDDQWSAVTGNFNTTYHFTSDTMGYVTVATGFKGGGYNGGFGSTTLAKRPFGQEEVTSYEVGMKTELGDRVRLNAAAFRADYEDFQSASYIGLQFLVNNAEEVRVQGVEADITARLTEGLTFDMGASYAHATYEKYTMGSCHTGRAPDNAAGGCDLSGETMPFAPKLTATAGLQWDQDIGPGTLTSRVDGSWVGEQNVTSELNPNYGLQDAYGLMNARLGWSQGTWEVSAWVRNALDKTYISQIAQSNLFATLQDGTYQSFLGAERTYGLTVRVKY